MVSWLTLAPVSNLLTISIGFSPVLLVDTEERVFAMLVGQPDDPSWGLRCMKLHDLMMEDQQSVGKLPQKNHIHRRGKYSTIGTGVTYSPGNREPHNLSLKPKEKEVIYQVSND